MADNNIKDMRIIHQTTVDPIVVDHDDHQRLFEATTDIGKYPFDLTFHNSYSSHLFVYDRSSTNAGR